MRMLRFAFCAAALVAAFYSCIWARAAYLAGQNTPSTVAQAVQLVPYNPAYVSKLAAFDETHKTALLHKAVELNPFDSDALIQLGLNEELSHDNFPGAESDYLRAAACDHTFVPRWTLTNFYFRRQNEPQLLHWAKETLQITPYSPDPVFSQLWMAGSDAALNETAIPSRPAVLLDYAKFLSANDYGSAIPPVIKRLTEVSSAQHADEVGPIEDRLLANGQAEPALAVWQTLNRSRWIQSGMPSETNALVNGSFTQLIFNHGFDWTLNRTPRVAAEQTTAGLSVQFDGSEPDEFTILQQYVIVQATASYSLTWTIAAAPGINPPSGIAWHMGVETSGDVLTPVDHICKFKPDQRLTKLELVYVRPSGQTRLNGRFELKSCALRKD